MTDPSCLFCKIVAGEIPSDTVHEDELVLGRARALQLPGAGHGDLDVLDERADVLGEDLVLGAGGVGRAVADLAKDADLSKYIL